VFNLDKYEKLLILFLIMALLSGVGISYYIKSRPSCDVRLTGFPPGFSLSGDQSLESPKIDINEAGADELAKLRGIGKVLAGRIVDYRQTRGPFSSAEEIMKVKGLGKSLFEKIKDNITVY
jgi:competence ComEA-like helix-hairpin-helix protein